MEKRNIPFVIILVVILSLTGFAFYNYFIGFPGSPSTPTGLSFSEGNTSTTLVVTNYSGKSGVYHLYDGSATKGAVAESNTISADTGTLEMWFYFTSSNLKTSIKFWYDEDCVVNWTQDGLITVDEWHRIKIVFDTNTRRYSVYVDGVVRELNKIFSFLTAPEVDKIEVVVPLGGENDVYFKLIDFSYT